MKNKSSMVLTLAIIAGTVIFTSCKKDKVKGCTDPNSISYNSEAEENDGSCLYAGTGGSTTIVAYPKHHGADTRPYHVYVKFNAQDSPGTDPWLYDLVVDADTTENHIEIENLKPGKYYIYEVAFDTSISDTVTGGIPYILTQTSGEVNLNIPVTE